MSDTSTAEAAAPASTRIHYAWTMLGVAFLYSVFATSSLGVPAVLILPMSRELGWSIGELAAPQGLRLAIFGLCAPLAGGLMLRYGPRRLTAISGVLLLIGLAISITMTTKWQLWLGMGVLLGVAPGITAMQLTAVVPARWFVAHRGLAVGVLGSAVATGTLTFMPLAAWVSEIANWRVALLIPTIGVLVAWLLFLWLARDRPQDIGLDPLGAKEPVPVPAAPTANFVQLSFAALAAGVKTRMFWLLAFTFGVCGLSSFGITQAHLVPFCGDIGVPLGVSAWLLAVIAVFDMIGTIGSGWLCDRYDNRWLLAMYYGLRGVALVWLVFGDVSTLALVTFAVIYGLDFIATVPPTVRLSVQTFGPDVGPAVFAWIFASHHVSAGLMAIATGVSRDLIGSYVPAFLFAGVSCIVAAALFVGAKKPPVRLAAA
ncbi:MAG TPA: MFS transporter [Ramlibacter sp.]|uniref:MFS transporter n=1 Tax=Ramlibacter sp. TaxID=1917967 RepID=UPI002C51D3BE|nr:MFS transporter [Ramlibacter sp.]HVZ45589.1 MFS transporter [Ramlibacter sp.]